MSPRKNWVTQEQNAISKKDSELKIGTNRNRVQIKFTNFALTDSVHESILRGSNVGEKGI